MRKNARKSAREKIAVLSLCLAAFLTLGACGCRAREDEMETAPPTTDDLLEDGAYSAAPDGTVEEDGDGEDHETVLPDVDGDGEPEIPPDDADDPDDRDDTDDAVKDELDEIGDDVRDTVEDLVEKARRARTGD